MTKARRIEAAIFDMGNVLVRFCHDRMRRQLAEATGLSTHEVAEVLSDGDLFRDFDRGTVSEAEFLQRLEVRAGRRLEREAVWKAACDIFEPMPESERLVADLKRLGVRLVLLSNTCAPHFAWVRKRHRFVEDFDALTLSYEAKAVKPEPAIFAAAIANAGFPPDRCFYTDDIPEYVFAGRSHGMQAEIFASAADCRNRLADLGVFD